MWHAWPETSYNDIAEVKLKDLTLSKDAKKQIVDICKQIHFSAKELAGKVLNESKFKSFITVKNFTDFIKY